jgi:signal recognition particle GTPase
MLGLQGSGNAESSATLALRSRSRAAGRCWWPATSSGPPRWSSCPCSAGQIDVAVNTEEGAKDPVKVVKAPWTGPKKTVSTPSSWDTTGRLQIDEAMMAELVGSATPPNPTSSSWWPTP